jgi:predicted DNA-binding protein (MmcQ/YjbR family)
MHVEWVRDYCLSFDEVEECQPFGPENLVYKIKGKMFLLISLDQIPPRINVKTDPDKSEELRETYPDNILPGFHMNKKHWNTLVLNTRLSLSLVQDLIKASYELVQYFF